MRCTRCGRQLAKGSPFCPTCGTRFDGKKLCPVCRNLIDGNSAICPFCQRVIDPALLQRQRMQQAQQQQQMMMQQQAQRTAASQRQPKSDSRSKRRRGDGLDQELASAPKSMDDLYTPAGRPPGWISITEIAGAGRSIKSRGLAAERERRSRKLFNLVSILLLIIVVAAAVPFASVISGTANGSVPLWGYFIGVFEMFGSPTTEIGALLKICLDGGLYVPLAFVGAFVLLQTAAAVYGVISLIVCFIRLFTRTMNYYSFRPFLNILLMQLSSLFVLAACGLGIAPGVGVYVALAGCVVMMLFCTVYNAVLDGRPFRGIYIVRSLLVAALASAGCAAAVFGALSISYHGGAAAVSQGGMLASADCLISQIFGTQFIGGTPIAYLCSATVDNAMIPYIALGSGVTAIIGFGLMAGAARRALEEVFTTYHIKSRILSLSVAALVFFAISAGAGLYLSIAANASAEGLVSVMITGFVPTAAALCTVLIVRFWKVR